MKNTGFAKKNFFAGGGGGGVKVEKWLLLKIESSVDLHAVSHSTLRRLKNVNQGGMPFTEILNTCTP